MFGSFGLPEMILIVIVIAVLFGGKKLPQLGKGLGEGIMNFKNSLKKDPDTEGDNKANNEKVN